MMSKFGPETPDLTKKTSAISKRFMQPEGSFPVAEKISKNQTEVYTVLTCFSLFMNMASRLTIPSSIVASILQFLIITLQLLL